MTVRVSVSCLLTLVALTTGCGLSENDMRKYAIKRAADDDDAPSKPETSAVTHWKELGDRIIASISCCSAAVDPVDDEIRCW